MATEKRPAAEPTVHVEVELKFDVPPGFTVPDLTGLPGVASLAPARDEHLDATYFDTPDLRLVLNRLTLRRRTGGSDAGWHLKRPRTDGHRDEIRHPLGRATRTVPAPIRDSVAVHTRGATLEPVVRLQTTRTVHELLDADGAVLAEVALDQVNASSPSANGTSTTVSTWTEVEVEQVGGNAKLLKGVAKRLRSAGAAPSTSASKLSRALGERLTAARAARPAPDPEAAALYADGTAGAVVLGYVAEQVAHLLAQDPIVRADGHDGVHQMRVACRRLRSVLAIFRPLFDRAVTDPIRDELQWLGGELGATRDAEVVRDHLRALAQAEPADLLMGPVVERIVTTMSTRYRAAHDEALRELAGPRYFAVLDTLDALVAAPPLLPVAGGEPSAVLLPLVRKTWKRTRALVAAAQAATEAANGSLHIDQHDVLLHDVRKAAKRARYAGESLEAYFGKDAKRYATRMSAIQEVLGDHQDSVVARAELRAMAVAAFLDGENAFSYGRLHALEEVRGERTEQAFEIAWAAADDPQYRTWMTP
jgi:CHAD domain-containing protein